jgi:hypothetical protein
MGPGEFSPPEPPPLGSRGAPGAAIQANRVSVLAPGSSVTASSPEGLRAASTSAQTTIACVKAETRNAGENRLPMVPAS